MNEIQLELPQLSLQLADPVKHTGLPKNDLYFYIDGSCRPNPGQMRVGLSLQYKDKQIYHYSELTGMGTNNAAEFCALIQALRALQLIQTEHDHPAAKIQCVIVSDSSTVINAVTKKSFLRSSILKPFLKEVDDLINALPIKPVLTWVPRSQNKAAHNLSVNQRKRKVLPRMSQSNLFGDEAY